MLSVAGDYFYSDAVQLFTYNILLSTVLVLLLMSLNLYHFWKSIDWIEILFAKDAC